MTFAEFFRHRCRVLHLCVFILCSGFVASQLAPAVGASGGRNFAGFFSLTDATEIGDQARLTFSARIFNYSDADVISATVTLLGPGVPDGVYAMFYGLTVPDKDSVRLTKDITIPLNQYRRWQQHVEMPILMVQYQASSGPQNETVELTDDPAGSK